MALTLRMMRFRLEELTNLCEEEAGIIDLVLLEKLIALKSSSIC